MIILLFKPLYKIGEEIVPKLGVKRIGVEVGVFAEDAASLSFCPSKLGSMWGLK